MEEIVNKVANSGLITLDLEDYYPEGDRVLYDIKDNLFQGIALREKEFRIFIKENQWQDYQDKYVAVHCSVDAIIPSWAFMLLASAINPYAKKVIFGDLEALEAGIFTDELKKIEVSKYEGERVIVKGCSKKTVPNSAYLELTKLLQPVVQSLMFGEACSTVPIYKRPKK